MVFLRFLLGRFNSRENMLEEFVLLFPSNRFMLFNFSLSKDIC